MDVSLRALAPVIGISVPSLFGYRSGAIPISPKAWSKLEQAERAADAPIIDEKYSSVLREDETPYRVTAMMEDLRGRMTADGLGPLLERIAKSLERLVEIEEGKKQE